MIEMCGKKFMDGPVEKECARNAGHTGRCCPYMDIPVEQPAPSPSETIESGFMEGAYARLKQLQEAERENATLHQIVNELAKLNLSESYCRSKDECNKAICSRCETLAKANALIRRAQEAIKP